MNKNPLSELFSCSGGDENVESLKEILKDAIHPDKIKPRVKVFTGLRSLDEGPLKNFWKGAYMTLAGRPSHGKSAWAVRYISEGLKRGMKVQLFTYEMTRKDFIYRILSQESDVPYSSIMDPINLSVSEKERLIAAGPATVDLVRSLETYVAPKMEEVYEAIESGKPDLVIIDYIQLVASMSISKPSELRITVDKILSTLAAIAKKHEIAIVGLAQFNRPERGRIKDMPSMYEIKESGAFEQASDIIKIVQWPYRVGSGCPDEDTANKIKIRLEVEGQRPWRPDVAYYKVNIAKNRNGECGYRDCIIIPDTNKFFDLSLDR
jgi:replicative DNA helicase